MTVDQRLEEIYLRKGYFTLAWNPGHNIGDMNNGALDFLTRESGETPIKIIGFGSKEEYLSERNTTILKHDPRHQAYYRFVPCD